MTQLFSFEPSRTAPALGTALCSGANSLQQSRPPGRSTGWRLSLRISKTKTLPASDCPGPVVEALEPHHSKQVQYDEYDGENDQNVNPAAGAREPWTNVRTEEAEQPQHYEYHDDGPQHAIPPSVGSIGCRLRMTEWRLA